MCSTKKLLSISFGESGEGRGLPSLGGFHEDLVTQLHGLRGSIPGNQDHAEPRFALHHAGVSVSGLFERKRLDHRANILEDAEGKGVLVINRRACQGAVDRAAAKDERERVQLDRILRYTDHDKFPANGET